jgi:ABC-type multidrug transport system ATPase subunit
VAAHRLSTVRDADRIITLVDGEFRQIGTHAELMKDRRGEYRRFHEQEQRREELETFIQDGGRPLAPSTTTWMSKNGRTETLARAFTVGSGCWD